LSLLQLKPASYSTQKLAFSDKKLMRAFEFFMTNLFAKKDFFFLPPFHESEENFLLLFDVDCWDVTRQILSLSLESFQLSISSQKSILHLC
jgi:hypothetical protein